MKKQENLLQPAINNISKLDRIDIIKLEEEVKELYNRQLILYNKIESIDNLLDKAILRYRYILGYTYEAIAEKTGYSEKQVYRILKKLDKKYKMSSNVQ